MKKILLSVVAVIVSLLVFVSGCNLITVDSERDMDQVIATVSISENAPTLEIRKKEMVMAFMNYGSYYAQNYGYTANQVYDLIIESLIQSKVNIQTALVEFGAEDSGKWDAVSYLNEDEKTEALYDTIKAMNDLIDNYEDKDELKKDSYKATLRTAPTNAAVDNEKTVAEMTEYNNLYKEKGANIGTAGSERYKAYNKLLKLLEANGLLEGEDVKYIKDSSYFNDTLTSNYEALLVEKYDEKVKADTRASVTYDKLKAEYVEMYNAKVSASIDPTAFETAIKDASKSNPVVYTPFTGYVYVYNLLLGASEEQTALIGKLDKDNLSDDEYAEKRASILSITTAEDQRESWILNGNDFDYDTLKFTGDYTLTTSENSLPFQGSVTRMAEKTEKDAAIYKINSKTSFTLADFSDKVDNYLYSATQTNAKASITSVASDANIYRVVNYNAPVAEYDEKVNELLFAFSTDSGSLNTYKGYLVSPEPDYSGSETYVKEFAKAGRTFVEEGLGARSYIAVATDYGYHYMFFSQKLGADTSYTTLDAYLDSLGVDRGAGTWADYLDNMRTNWKDYEDSDFYLYTLLNLYADADNVLSEKKTAIYDKLKNDETKIVKYEARYADLMSE